MKERVRHNYKNLLVWKLAIEITNDTYALTSLFPKDEKFGLSSQMNRSAVSMASNIAEDSARTDASFSHFIDISLGSSFELATQLVISHNRNYIANKTYLELEIKIEQFQKMAIGFQKSL